MKATCPGLQSQRRQNPNERRFPLPHPDSDTVPRSWSFCCLQVFGLWTSSWLFFYFPELFLDQGGVQEVGGGRCAGRPCLPAARPLQPMGRGGVVPQVFVFSGRTDPSWGQGGLGAGGMLSLGLRPASSTHRKSQSHWAWDIRLGQSREFAPMPRELGAVREWSDPASPGSAGRWCLPDRWDSCTLWDHALPAQVAPFTLLG